MFRVRDDFRRAQFAIAALFLILGFQYGTWASRLPTIKARLDLSTAEVGLLLMACGVGAAASFPLVTWLMKRLGSRRLSVWSANGYRVQHGVELPASYGRDAMYMSRAV